MVHSWGSEIGFRIKKVVIIISWSSERNKKIKLKIWKKIKQKEIAHGDI